MRILIAGACGLTLAAAIAITAQNTIISTGSAYFHSSKSLNEMGVKLLPEATNKGSSITQTLETFPGSITSLSVRTASGGGELHQRWQDNFFIVSGEATEMTGGSVVDPKETTPGEIRGSRVDGGESHILRKGDVLHVAANTPHQMILAPGASIVYYVIKVEEPTARLMPAAK